MKIFSKGYGPLGEDYPRSGWYSENPGEWDGKFIQPDPKKNHWVDDPVDREAVHIWMADVQAELKERADWMLS